jgi:hypothetical protein
MGIIKNNKTTSIEIPDYLIEEVKQFINLRLTGEIDSLSHILSLAGFGKPKLFDLSKPDLNLLWKEVVDATTPPSTRALLRRHSQLKSLTENKAVLNIDKEKLKNICLEKTPNIEAAFKEVCDRDIKIELVTEETIDSTNNKSKPSELTTSQKDALSQLQDFTFKSDRYFRLSGYAGTGKSFLMIRFIKWLREQGFTFIAACPTNKAAKNLSKLADEELLDLEVKTVAQLLRQQPELNEDTGKEEFICNGEPDFTGYNIVIIDEFSMVSRDNFAEIVNAVSLSLLTKVVFVGDPAQLPPINEDKPIVSTSELIERHANLNEIIRYDGELAKVAERIRNGQFNYNFTTSADKTILVIPQSEWLDRAIELFESGEYRQNPDYVRFLAWRNRTVDALNKFVRNKLWGEIALPYVPGDRLIARKPIFRTIPGGKGKNKWRILINNSEEAEVIDSAQLFELVFQKQNYQYWSVRVQPEIGKPQTLSILHSCSIQLHKEQIKYFAAHKQWNYYFDLSRMFDDIGYAYALTTHKAQGSTLDNVFLDFGDMKISGDRQKLLYTALTRTKTQVLIPQK